MTIGQLVETLLGKVGVLYGGFGDCTAFANKGPNTEVYGEILVRAGYHSSGNQLLYNGMTGEQIYSEIYIGPTYYMRLKHMVKDKINYRARGPNTMLTRQSVQGRANDGGLRIGEMERDGILAHGCAGFLNESYLIRGDEYFMAVCNKTGSIAVYNKSMNLFLSLFSDGPIKFNTTLDGKMNIQNVSRFGRSFSIVRVPYALKLLIQELQVMNIQMRIITEDNIDQLMSMSYSNNINKLLLDTDNTDLKQLMVQNRNNMKKNKEAGINPFEQIKELPEYNNASPEYVIGSPAFQPSDSSEYKPPESISPYEVNTPGSPAESVNPYEDNTPDFSPPPLASSIAQDTNPQIKIKNPELKAKWEALPEGDKKILAEMIAKKKAENVMGKVERKEGKEEGNEGNVEGNEGNVEGNEGNVEGNEGNVEGNEGNVEGNVEGEQGALAFKPEPVEAQHMGGSLSILNIEEKKEKEEIGKDNKSIDGSTKSITINL